MQKAIYNNFLRQYAENRPYEDIATQKALAHFNRLSEEKPYEITDVQEKENYKTIQYDAKLDNGETSIKIEVKTDHKSRQTGNCFIEFSQYGKASGFATTEADYYVINDTLDYYLISVEDIGEILRVMDADDELKDISVRTPFGKKMVTKGWLIKQNRMISKAVCIT